MHRCCRTSKAEYFGNAIVWRIDPNGNICFSQQGQSREINARHILIATGAWGSRMASLVDDHLPLKPEVSLQAFSMKRFS